MSVLLGSPLLVKKNEDSRLDTLAVGRLTIWSYKCTGEICPVACYSALCVTFSLPSYFNLWGTFVTQAKSWFTSRWHHSVDVEDFKGSTRQQKPNMYRRSNKDADSKLNRKPTCAIWPWKCCVVPEMAKICPPTTIRTNIQHRRKENEISTLFTSHLTNQSVPIIMIQANQSPIPRRRVHGTLGPWEQQNTVQWLNSCIKVRENNSHC